ncbi:hypothetical protein [Streptomyces sp. T028]|uniref:hypothetical protein n=1 Tax=Streptomyces sp. T028 TaxID=3394379 RepID=UPI003A880287
MIEEGVRKGQSRPVDARATALVVAGMCNWVAWWHHPGDHHFTDAEAAGHMADLAVAMVLRPESRTRKPPDPRRRSRSSGRTWTTSNASWRRDRVRQESGAVLEQSCQPRVRPSSPARTPAWNRDSALRVTRSSATRRR